MTKKVFDTRFEDELKKYSERYDVESLTNPNDQANLHIMIRNKIIIDDLQARMYELAQTDVVANSMDIKKINDTLISLADVNIKLERTLGIDRKTRKQDQAETTVDYLAKLKLLAREFLDDTDRLQKVFCKTCNIMVGRISGVYSTTYYTAAFQCPQCQNQITLTRKERDVFFDVKDADWRRKYPIEIVQPKRIKSAPDIPLSENELLIGIEEEGQEGNE